MLRPCAISDVLVDSVLAWMTRRTNWENGMTWKTPKIVEVSVGMEINMYACAARK
jgi:coenzyme PQQ precursor peptide PqqA